MRLPPRVAVWGCYLGLSSGVTVWILRHRAGAGRALSSDRIWACFSVVGHGSAPRPAVAASRAGAAFLRLSLSGIAARCRGSGLCPGHWLCATGQGRGALSSDRIRACFSVVGRGSVVGPACAASRVGAAFLRPLPGVAVRGYCLGSAPRGREGVRSPLGCFGSALGAWLCGRGNGSASGSLVLRHRAGASLSASAGALFSLVEPPCCPCIYQCKVVKLNWYILCMTNARGRGEHLPLRPVNVYTPKNLWRRII